MGRVWRLRNLTFVALLGVAALLLLLARGTDEAEAAPFAPTLSTALVSSAAGAVSDVTTVTNWGTFPSPTRNIPGSFSGFTPGTWGMYAASASDSVGTTTDGIPIGDRTGTAFTVTTLGLLNSACAINIPISFSGGAQPPLTPAGGTTGFMDASTDNSAANTISPGAGFAALVADSNSNGVFDGAERWNTLLTALGLPSPRERQVAKTELFGTVVWVDIVTYSPGVLAPAGLGYITLTIIENFSPALPASPSLITDSCGLTVTATQQGVSTVAGGSHRTNPPPNLTTGGTEIFFGLSTSDRDADLDPPLPDGIGFTTTGFVNNDDTCPFTPNVGSPFAPAPPFNGDGGESPGDGIDAACDANPLVFDGGDADGDAFLNRQDNCPQVANPSQSDVLEIAAGPPVDGGPATDGIGDACDSHPHGGGRLPAVIDHTGVADGHFHTVLNVSPKCLTAAFPGFSDSDGDGWCDATEFGLGSSPASPASTPESLSIPNTCSDGVDNDGDGSTDLGDTGCQLPDHDLAIRKITGDSVIGGTSECQPNAPGGCGENIIIQNNTGQEEKGQVGILIDPIFGAGCSGPSVQLHGGSASPVLVKSGPLNVDGDSDIEYLMVVDVTIPANSQRTVNVGVVFPSCGPTVGTSADYVKIVDLCHANDVAPLGLFGLQACGGAADGGQDRLNQGNDAPIIKVLNDVGR